MLLARLPAVPARRELGVTASDRRNVHRLVGFAYAGIPSTSILDRRLFRGTLPFAHWQWWTSTPSFHVAIAGLLLIGIFTFQMVSGTASLPLALPDSSVGKTGNVQSWRRILVVIWVVIGPLFFASTIPGIALAGIALTVTTNASTFLQNPAVEYANSILESMIFLFVVAWITGTEGRETMKKAIRLSRPRFLYLAAVLSIGIGLLISAGQFLVDRSRWAATQFGEMAAPLPSLYFTIPSPWYLFMFFAACTEEIVFRGLLQAYFVRRYGVARGIFLTGITWAAYHFNSDAWTHPTELAALSKVAFRISMCVAFGFVLSWLTIRSGSVLPAAITHTLYNVLVSGFGPSFQGKAMVWVGCWAVLAWVLFHYWPIADPIGPDLEAPAAEPGIAN